MLERSRRWIKDKATHNRTIDRLVGRRRKSRRARLVSSTGNKVSKGEGTVRLAVEERELVDNVVGLVEKGALGVPVADIRNERHDGEEEEGEPKDTLPYTLVPTPSMLAASSEIWPINE